MTHSILNINIITAKVAKFFSQRAQREIKCDFTFAFFGILGDLCLQINNTMKQIVENIREELSRNADDKIKASGERFFKEAVLMYGLKSALVTAISREHFRNLADNSKTNVFPVCEELWKSGYIEESFVACNWSYYVRKQYELNDFPTFEKWVHSYVNNWASCDTFCNHSVGTLVEMHPGLLEELKRWAMSDNRWVRRAAAVSLIVPARNGKFIRDIFEIADILHSDSDDMVQKGYGWMLKEASKPHCAEVFEYIIKKKVTMPRTALRYAIEKMPDELKKSAMAK
jgi:3-methyladenine DNA glycosylase AlkD